MHALNLTINEGIAMPTYSAVSVTTSLANSIMMYTVNVEILAVHLSWRFGD